MNMTFHPQQVDQVAAFGKEGKRDASEKERCRHHFYVDKELAVFTFSSATHFS